jgi:hypothetical protein
LQKKQASKAKELSEKEHAVKGCDTNINKALQNRAPGKYSSIQ